MRKTIQALEFAPSLSIPVRQNDQKMRYIVLWDEKCNLVDDPWKARKAWLIQQTIRNRPLINLTENGYKQMHLFVHLSTTDDRQLDQIPIGPKISPVQACLRTITFVMDDNRLSLDCLRRLTDLDLTWTDIAFFRFIFMITSSTLSFPCNRP